MKYVKTGDVLAVRLDPGEEIIASVLKIAKDENIRFAEISAIGDARCSGSMTSTSRNTTALPSTNRSS